MIHVRRRSRIAAAFAAIVLFATDTADAHLVQTGFGSFYDGLVHVLITVEDLLLVLGLALLAGTCGKPESRALLVALPLAWLLGAISGSFLQGAEAWVLPTTVSFTLIGILVAGNVKIPRPALTGLACLTGVLHGGINGVTLSPGGEALEVTGVVLAVFTLTTLFTAAVVSLRAGWTRIAVRVAGSWIVAIGMLMTGWAFRT